MNYEFWIMSGESVRLYPYTRRSWICVPTWIRSKKNLPRLCKMLCSALWHTTDGVSQFDCSKELFVGIHSMCNSECYACKVTIYGGVKLARFGVVLDINTVEWLVILWHSVIDFRGDYSSSYGVLELREVRRYLYQRLRLRIRVPLVALLAGLLDSLPSFLDFLSAFLVEHGCNLITFVDDDVGEVLEACFEALRVVTDRERHSDSDT